MTLLALRRLALRATRQPELLPALQDALLESRLGPLLEETIAAAHRRAADYPRTSTWIVFFYPFARKHLRYLSRAFWFDVYSFRDSDLHVDDPDSRLRRLIREGNIPVYFVPPTGRARR